MDISTYRELLALPRKKKRNHNNIENAPGHLSVNIRTQTQQQQNLEIGTQSTNLRYFNIN